MKNENSKSVLKTIHYCWFGEKPLPESAKKCIASWKKFMPDYEIKEWNESNFDVSENRYAEEAYENRMYAFVSDYARLKIIYDNGGIYFDTDVELIKPIPEELLKNGYLAKEDKSHINTGLGFAARKSDKTIKKMLDGYKNAAFIKDDGSLDKISCPVRNTESIEREIQKKNGLEFIDEKPILSKEYAAPLDWRTGEIKKTKKTFSIHYGAASWLDDDIKLRLKLRKDYVKKYGKVIGLTMFKMGRLFGVIK